MSNDIRSKQFIKIFKKSGTDGTYESMVQRVYRQIKGADTSAKIMVATSKSQVSSLHNQLCENAGISIEPCRRDTFPAIALATAYLHDVKDISEDESVVVCLVDSYVNDDCFEAIKRLRDLAQNETANLVLMGIAPTYPNEKYGYIIPADTEISKVLEFKEKPDAETAQRYIEQGGFWNGGVFAYKLSYVLQRARELIGFSDYDDLFEKYDTLKKISFDYAAVEHEQDITIMRFSGEWKDFGTWNTLTEEMEENAVGDVRLNSACENTQVINELGIPIIATGIRDVVIAASPEGILISDKEQSSYIKPLVDEIDQQIMFAEKSWGSFGF